MVSLDTVTCISGRSNEKLMTVAAPGGISIGGGGRILEDRRRKEITFHCVSFSIIKMFYHEYV